MNAKKNLITEKTFYEYKEEQKRLIENINKSNKKITLLIITFSLILSGISSVASYSFAAGNVGYTPMDTTWNVQNTGNAIDDLREDIGTSLVGAIYSYMGTRPPYGYLVCDGSVYNISDYPHLANHIKGQFGSYNFFGGNGTTTFAVPDLRGEFLRGSGTNATTNLSGSNVGIHQSQGLPNITGEFEDVNHLERARGSGAFTVTATYEYSGTGSGGAFGNRGPVTYSFDASNSNPIYGNSSDVRPTNTSVLYIIKY